MRFAPNRLYIEAYNKCHNCGLLLYERPENTKSETITVDGQTYCSDWCVNWERERNKRLAAEAAE